MGKLGGDNVGDIWVVTEIDADEAKTVLFPNKLFELFAFVVLLLAAAVVKHVAAAGADMDGFDGSLIGLSANSVR